MSKYSKIIGLVCIGIPDNFEWIKHMINLPNYFILCEENYVSYTVYRSLDFLSYYTFDVGYFPILDSNVFKRAIPFNTLNRGLIGKNGSWAMCSPLYVQCTVDIIKTGKIIIKDVKVL